MSSEKVNSIEFLQFLKNNDAEAWQYLIRIYFPVLCRFAQKILQDKAAAEDIVTDVFIKLYQKTPEFEHINHVKKHLYVTTRNASLNFIRSREREKLRNEIYVNFHLQEEDNKYEEEILFSELLAEIRKEVDKLPPKMREIFILSYFKKMTNEDIASYLQLSNQTVRNQKTSALALLRKVLKGRYTFHLLIILLNVQKFCK